jgi:phage gp29-like protein
MSNNPIQGIPPLGEILSESVQTDLVRSGRAFGSLRLSQAFGGQSDPSVIWASLIGDRQDAYMFMRELEEKDEDVATHIDTLKLAVIGQECMIKPADESQGATEIAEFVEDVLERIPNWHDSLYSMLDAAPYGLSIHEIIWGFGNINKRWSVTIEAVKDRPQELFCFNPRWYPQIGQLRFLRSVFDASGGELVPEEKFVIFSHRPRAGIRRGRPLLRSVFWPSWFKRQGLRMWLRFAEKGPGTAVVKYRSGSDDEANKALQAAEEIIEKIAVAVPENFEIVHELLTSARATSPDTYIKLVERQETAIARRILGQSLTSRGNEGGKGSNALGKVHENIFDLVWTALAKQLAYVVNEQLVKPLVTYNYGPDAPMPKWMLAIEPEENLKDEVTVDDTLQQMGYPISKQYVAEKYGRPIPESGDEILERTQTGAQLGPDGLPISGAGNSDPSNYADEPPKNLEDVKRLIAQMKEKSFDVFKARVLALTEEARTGRRL